MIGPEERRALFDQGLESERLLRCFDPDVSHVEGAHEHLVISPRWGRLRRGHPLLATTQKGYGQAAAWVTARENLLHCRDRSVQLAISTYQHRVRVTARISMQVLCDPRFDLLRHCHTLLDKGGAEKNAVPLGRDTFWIRTLLPDPEGYAQFEFGNTFLVPITADAILRESKTLL
jgi:hypothetical protein